MGGYYQGEDETLRPTTFIGMIVGFAATFIFFVYVGLRICKDESKRMAYYQSKVVKAQTKLTETFQYSEGMMKIIEKKFEDRDAGVEDAVDDETK